MASVHGKASLNYSSSGTGTEISNCNMRGQGERRRWHTGYTNIWECWQWGNIAASRKSDAKITHRAFPWVQALLPSSGCKVPPASPESFRAWIKCWKRRAELDEHREELWCHSGGPPFVRAQGGEKDRSHYPQCGAGRGGSSPSEIPSSAEWRFNDVRNSGSYPKHCRSKGLTLWYPGDTGGF